jgi:methyl-accepting chemotaxis protein
MTGPFKRRQLFVHPVQYWFVATTLIYFMCLLIVLYAVVFLPMVQPLNDPSVSWQERAQVATEFLDLNARVWPWLLVTFLGLLLHSMYFMHRIAGPLYRFTMLFRTIGGGQLHQRAILRKHDYLHREARDFNAMLDNLEQKIEALNLHCAIVTEAYEDVALQIQQQSSGQINAALQTLEEEILRFKTCLAEFRPQDTQPPHVQQRFNFAGPISRDSPAAMKAA